ncbi:Arm DNA-binding domain-containing protein [Mesobacillus maritimus]
MYEHCNHQGHREKRGTYYYVLESGKDANGKRVRIKRRGFKKLSEAKTAMAKLMLELEAGSHLRENKMPLSEYLDCWLENYA